MSAHLHTLARRYSPETVPVFHLNGVVLLPGCELPLNVFEPRYLKMIEDALRADRLIAIVQGAVDHVAPIIQEDSDDQGLAPLSHIGTLGRITEFHELEDGRYMIAVTGLKRFERTGEAERTKPYREVHVNYNKFEMDVEAHNTPILPPVIGEDMAERARMIVAMKAYARTLRVEVDWDVLARVPMPNLVDQATMMSPFSAYDKQTLLEAPDNDTRRRLLEGLMKLYSESKMTDSVSKNN